MTRLLPYGLFKTSLTRCSVIFLWILVLKIPDDWLILASTPFCSCCLHVIFSQHRAQPISALSECLVSVGCVRLTFLGYGSTQKDAFLVLKLYHSTKIWICHSFVEAYGRVCFKKFRVRLKGFFQGRSKATQPAKIFRSWTWVDLSKVQRLIATLSVSDLASSVATWSSSSARSCA